MNYSVVIGRFPTISLDFDRYIQAVGLAFPDAQEIVISRVDYANWEAINGSPFPATEAQRSCRVGSPEGPDGWASLNRAIASTKTEHVVVLEDVWWPSPGAQDALIAAQNTHSGTLIRFDRRDTTWNETYKVAAGEDIRSAPRPADSPGYAYAVVRRDFLILRGYDERSAYERLASVDFRVRAHRLGLKEVLLEGSAGTVYHAPNPSTPSDNDRPKSASLRSEINDEVSKDASIFRNLIEWSVPPEHRIPLVSVAIATKDRGEIIADSLNSVLGQSFQDFEIVVVDDGSQDEVAKDVIDEIGDTRIRYIRQNAAGISAARNRAADSTECYLTAVHDDDDIMLPDRLEMGISTLTSECCASYGSWINFSDETGEMRGFLGKIGFGADINAFNGQGPGHSTWTLPTWLIQTLRYDERLTASVDHNLASRLNWAGVHWVHTEKFMYLRRVHEKQVTASDGTGQKIGHALTRYGNNFLCSRAQRQAMWSSGKSAKYPSLPGNAQLFHIYGGYLPDKLVTRRVVFRKDITNSQFLTDMPDRLSYVLEDRDLLTGRAFFDAAALDEVSLRDLADLRRRGLYGFEVQARVRSQEEGSGGQIDDSSMVDIEEYAMATSEVTAREVSEKRAEALITSHLNQYPTGCVLVQRDSEAYHEFVDDYLLDGSKMARRVVAVGEFGSASAIRLYGYSHRMTGLTRLRTRSLEEEVPTYALYTREDLSAFTRGLADGTAI